MVRTYTYCPDCEDWEDIEKFTDNNTTAVMACGFRTTLTPDAKIVCER